MGSLFERMKFSHKLMLLGGIALILLAAPSLMVIRGEFAAIARAEREVSGLAPLWSTLKLVQQTQLHRGLSNLALGGQDDLLPDWADARQKTHAASQELQRAAIQLDNILLQEKIALIGKRWQALVDQIEAQQISREESFRLHTGLVADLLALVDDITIDSGISLHQETAGHYLQAAVVQYLPGVTENLGQLRAHGALALSRQEAGVEERRQLAALAGSIQSDLSAARKALLLATASDPALQQHLQVPMAQALAQTGSALSLIDMHILYSSQLSLPYRDYFNNLTRTIDTQFGLIEVSFQALQAQLKKSVKTSKRRLSWIGLGLAGLLSLLGATLLIVMRAESARRQSDLRFRAILDAAPDAIIISDNDNRILLVNHATQSLYATPASELIGQPVSILSPADTRAALHEELMCLRQSDDHASVGQTRQMQGQARGGRLFPIEVTRSLLDMEDGSWIISVVRDISERQQLEQQLLQSQKMEAIGQLTGGVAHDFNNLLGIIVGNLDLLERIVATQPAALKRVHTAQKAALRGADLTKRLLAFSRRQHLQPAAVQLADTITNLVEMAARTLGPDIRIVTDIETTTPTIHVDAAALENALLNLAVNARDAMPDGGTLTFSTHRVELDQDFPAVHAGEIGPGSYVCLRISDTGHGMTPEQLKHAFEPFFTTKERGKGTGLGLAMVYGFVKQSGGYIRLYSEIGIGTTVSMLLPVADENDAVAHASLSASPNYQAVPGMVALVVDDEPDLLEIATTHLTEIGYRVIQATDGPSALSAQAQADRIDLLLTDVIMPGGMNGVKLAEQIRALRPGIRTIYTSGFPSQTLAERNGTRIDGPLLNKPYVKGEFVKMISQVMEETRA